MTEMFTLLDPPDSPAHDSMVEKKSEFIGDACHVDSLEDALAFVESIREQHPKSRHVAYAAICGGADGRLSERMSDDGEPSGTAGKPILDVLRANGLTDCVVAVTRYFGGILLGTGGLVRAYTAAASGALQRAELVSMRLVVDCRVRLPYALFEQAQRLIQASGAKLQEPVFDDAVTLEWRMPAGEESPLWQALSELTRGTAQVEVAAPAYAPF